MRHVLVSFSCCCSLLLVPSAWRVRKKMVFLLSLFGLEFYMSSNPHVTPKP
uniref:Uncharacterized protein n=1 Tax=Setaria italica TaxID=4555 RepID=K3YBN7_SETIT